MLDLTGEKYGILTVLKEAPRKGGVRTWTCQCQCGKIKDIRQGDLRGGKTLSCGCLGREKRILASQTKAAERKENPKPYIDLTGKKFNYLTVLSFDLEYTKEKRLNNPSGSKCTYWKCQCDCGEILTVRGPDLTNNHTKSCGCHSKQKSAETMKNFVQPLSVIKNTANLSGQKFGKLTVLELDLEKSNKGKGSFWFCQCDCGTVKSVSYKNLVSNHTQSCGCLGNSLGEYKIETILKENNINYKKEYKFIDLKDKSYLRFDFAIFNDNQELIKLIEYNGRQHTDSTSIWHDEPLLKHDKMKIDYCKQHNIELLIIPYQDYEQITFEYLKIK